MRHLLDTKSLEKDEILELFKRAKIFLEKDANSLEGKIICLLFYENSTRTQSSFQTAVIRLKGHALKLDVSKSSKSKGEDLYDTAKNLAAMRPSALVLRHSSSGIASLLSKKVDIPILNAGDGKYAHPSQALLDLFTIMEYFKTQDLKDLKIAIIGDIKNSRVANSNIELLSRFGLDITLVGPPHFLPKTKLKYSYDLQEVINKQDILMSLRTQTERQNTQTYGSLRDYARDFCIKEEYFHGKIPLILHPGPVHKNIDIQSKLMQKAQCKILKQVENGVAVRMALLENFTKA